MKNNCCEKCFDRITEHFGDGEGIRRGVSLTHNVCTNKNCPCHSGTGEASVPQNKTYPAGHHGSDYMAGGECLRCEDEASASHTPPMKEKIEVTFIDKIVEEFDNVPQTNLTTKEWLRSTLKSLLTSINGEISEDLRARSRKYGEWLMEAEKNRDHQGRLIYLSKEQEADDIAAAIQSHLKKYY